MAWKRIISKKEDHRKALNQIREYLMLHNQQLIEDLNFRLLCDTELENCMHERVLWVEEIVVTDVGIYHKSKESWLHRKLSDLKKLKNKRKGRN